MPVGKKIGQYDLTTGELVKIWRNQTDASIALGVPQANISECCNGKRKTAGGFGWAVYEGGKNNGRKE